MPEASIHTSGEPCIQVTRTHASPSCMINDILKSDQLSTSASLKAARLPVAVLVNVTFSGVSHLTSQPVGSQ